jgi:23S rRNA G2069 N7-methylase RlmK/C1962 C5-methylase RlmI
MHVFSASLTKLSEQLIPVLQEVHTPKSIYVQRRYRPLGGEGPREPAELAWGEVAPVEIEVREGSLRFGVDVTAPLGTGLFPDLRNGRIAVAARAKIGGS